MFQAFLYRVCMQAHEAYVSQDGIVQPNGRAGEISRSATGVVCQEGPAWEMHGR